MNVLRAFARNVKVLGFDSIALSQEGAISPFFTDPTRTTSSLPPSLRLTALQRRVLHHPVYDIFPDPVLRDQILLCRGLNDDDSLCWDLVGLPSSRHGDRDGLLVWGEPHCVDSWEASEAFLRRYPALLAGCTNLIASSNRWRSARGEPPLMIEDLYGHQLETKIE